MTNKPELVPVEFVKNQPPYLSGEKTRRSPKDASALVDLGMAKYLDPPPGLDEFGQPLKAAATKPTTPKPKAKAKPKGKGKPKP